MAVVALSTGAYATQKQFAQKYRDARPSTVQSAKATTTAAANVVPVPIRAAGTALDAMRAYASSEKFAFTGREYSSLGFFVESINGRKNAGGSYWFLYINGAASEKGVSQAVLRPGDVVEWRYEKEY